MTSSPAPSPIELPLVTRVVETVLPTAHGTFRLVGFQGEDGTEHVALCMGIHDSARPSTTPLVRLHSECLTGDALGSWRCDCGTQLDAALARIAAEEVGVLVYVRGHEGRGIGLLEKLKAYRLQDAGADTLEANLALGHPGDARDYGQAAAVLADLGLHRIRLMSSNPAKELALRAHGIRVVERTGMFVPEHAENLAYLTTKRERMGHDRPTDNAWQQLLDGHVPVSTHTPREADLVERYGPLVQTKPAVVVAQMAQSLDGFIATRSGDGAALSGAEDHEHLHRLRALVQAVIVGVGTVVADDPRLTVREVPGPNPVRVVLDPEGRVPTDAAVLTDAAAPTLWVVGSGARRDGLGDDVEMVELPCGESGFDPARVLTMLAERGLRRVLVEGGGRTVSSFLRAKCLDRLYVTTVPILLGDGVPGVRSRVSEHMADALRAPSRRFLLGDDVCTELTFR